jgi:branched-chain amino acid transport system ATP-binding protein
VTGPVLATQHLAAGYGRLPVLFDVSFEVALAEVVVVSAGNGAGKSTLLSSVSGLLRPISGGQVLLVGEDVTSVPAHVNARHGLVHVLERRRLAPFMTVRDNLLLSESAVPREHRAEWARLMSHYEDSQPLLRSHGHRMAGELSGGQQQLVAILRGLLSRPRILLLDEPFQGLDVGVVQDVVTLLLDAREKGVAVVLTEHRTEIVEGLADRTIRLERGEIVSEVMH